MHRWWGVPGDLPYLHRLRGEPVAWTSPADPTADSSAADANNASACADARPDDSTRTCSELLQVVKQLRWKLRKRVLQLEPGELRWLWWDLVRPDNAEHCEPSRGVSNLEEL